MVGPESRAGTEHPRDLGNAGRLGDRLAYGVAHSLSASDQADSAGPTAVPPCRSVDHCRLRHRADLGAGAGAALLDVRLDDAAPLSVGTSLASGHIAAGDR